MKYRRGFTLIELLTVMAVAGLLVAVGMPALNSFKKAAAVNEGVQGLVGVLRQEQSLATANHGNDVHKIHYVSASQYTVLTGTTTTATINLPNNISFAASFNDVVFARLTGAATCPPSTPPCQITFNGTPKVINITSVGTVSAQ